MHRLVKAFPARPRDKHPNLIIMLAYSIFVF